MSEYLIKIERKDKEDKQIHIDIEEISKSTRCTEMFFSEQALNL